MNIRIWPDRNQESYQLTALLQQIHAYGQGFDLVYNALDLIDPDKPASLENLPVPKNLLAYANRVVFEDQDQLLTVVWKREVNNSGIRRRTHD